MEQQIQWNNLFRRFKGSLLGACLFSTQNEEGFIFPSSPRAAGAPSRQMCGCKAGNFQLEIQPLPPSEKAQSMKPLKNKIIHRISHCDCMPWLVSSSRCFGTITDERENQRPDYDVKVRLSPRGRVFSAAARAVLCPL